MSISLQERDVQQRPRDPVSTPRICVVVPAFNEGFSVGGVVSEVRSCLPDAEIVVVDDGSEDETARIAAEAGATVVGLPVNLGIGGAVQAGYRYALEQGFDIAVQIDGDGQHPPREARELIRPIVRGEADMVVGSRWLGQGEYVASRIRRVSMHVLAHLVRWRTAGSFTDTTSGFRAVGRRAIEVFASSYPTDFPEVESIVLAHRFGLVVTEVPVTMESRNSGISSISGLRTGYYMLRVIVVLLVDRLNGKAGR